MKRSSLYPLLLEEFGASNLFAWRKDENETCKTRTHKTKSQRFEMHSIRRNFAYWIECCNQQQQHLNWESFNLRKLIALDK